MLLIGNHTTVNPGIIEVLLFGNIWINLFCYTRFHYRYNKTVATFINRFLNYCWTLSIIITTIQVLCNNFILIYDHCYKQSFVNESSKFLSFNVNWPNHQIENERKYSILDISIFNYILDRKYRRRYDLINLCQNISKFPFRFLLYMIFAEIVVFW